MKTNYVIACWMGARGSEDARQMVDRAFFVRQQMRYLERVVHNLDQVTVVVARGGDAYMIIQELLTQKFLWGGGTDAGT